MVQNRTRKTMRHFQCRDDLWGLFEKMAVELECSVDYLINEAMRQYARSRKYATPQGRDSSIPPESFQGESAGTPPPGVPMGGVPPTPQGVVRPIAPPPAGQRISAPPPMPQPSPQVAPPAQSIPPQPQVTQPAMPRQSIPQSPFSPVPPSQYMQKQPSVPMRPTMDTDPFGRVASPQPPTPSGLFPMGGAPSTTPPPGPASIPQMAGTIPTLYLIFNGQRIPITKEQFIIGRGLKTSDLAIKDGNISRKHAAIIYHNGAYYIKDLGSVNGIEFAGKRIDSKRIDEGDVFHICDYELRFTYK